MLARAYGSVGTKGSLVQEWGAEELTGNLASVGNDRGGAIAISNALGRVQRVQICDIEGKPRASALGTKGRSAGEFMAPCQTALSADSAVLAVADSGNNRVQLFDATTREYLASVGRRGQIRPGRMQGPEGVAFVDGRREMIVADTGNNRLQVFHVKELAAAPDAPSSQDKAAVNGINGVLHPGCMPLDSFAADNSQPSSLGSLVNWAQSQAPTQRGNNDEAKAGAEGGGGRNRPTVPRQSRASERQGNTAVLEGGGSNDHSHGCLLVFTGGENAGKIRKRRTAGESETGEGPLSQPSDVAYWKVRSKEDTVVLRAWAPDVPPWFCRSTSGSGGSGGGGGGFSPAAADEAFLREELLSPHLPPGVTPAPLNNFTPGASSGERKQSNQPSSERKRGKKVGLSREESGPDSDTDCGGGGGGGGVDGGGPKAGAFVVRETGVPGKLQLLFVAKTKEAEELDAAKENRKKKNGSVSGLSQDGSGYSGGPRWMKSRGSAESIFTATPEGSGKEPSGTVDMEERGGYDTASSTATPSTQAPTLEVRDELITVLDQGKGVEICGRAYGCLLSLLRAFRGRGFERLVGTTDTRGDRGIVAVAERGGGRVRLLHYAPALRPFYQAELTHLHSIEGLRRPSSVSFSSAGDLLIADKAARKVTVYACLSGKWTHVHDFGPERGKACPDGTIGGGSERSPPCPCLASYPGEEVCKRGQEIPHRGGKTTDHKKAFQESTSTPTVESGGGGSNGQGSTAFGREPITGASSCWSENEKEEGREEGRGEDMREPIEWAQGVPVSARFVTFKVTEGESSTAACGSDGGDARDMAIVVGTSDGAVRAMSGPAKRHCGSFAALHNDTALRIVELLGYTSSQVVACVNRTMSNIRTRLRREWRLHPLTPGALAKATLEFLQWGRFTTGEGLPGRGSAIDATGRKLCDQFLATSTCARPACPYSHGQPWVDPACATNEKACILFRGGVVHAVTNLYGQIFAWEWEGDLYRLFRDRSSLRAIVTRRDPMTRGIHGAEAIRDCVEEERHVLNYSGFVDFATVVHEHVIGLRPWHSQASSRPSSARGTPPTTTDRRGDGKGKELSPAGGGARGAGPEGGSDSLLSKVQMRGEEKSVNGVYTGSDGEGGGGGGQRKGPDETMHELTGRTAAEKETTPRGSLEGEKKLRQGCAGLRKEQQRYSSPLRRSNPAVPWLGWDVAQTVGDAVDTASVSVSDDVGDGNPRAEGKGGFETEEEPKMNRRYGTTAEEREASVNKVIAFQTDRVVRMLDRMF